LQPGMHGVAAWDAWGCSLGCMGLQPGIRRVAQYLRLTTYYSTRYAPSAAFRSHTRSRLRSLALASVEARPLTWSGLGLGFGFAFGFGFGLGLGLGLRLARERRGEALTWGVIIGNTRLGLGSRRGAHRGLHALEQAAVHLPPG